jgi:hypothetical protein
VLAYSSLDIFLLSLRNLQHRSECEAMVNVMEEPNGTALRRCDRSTREIERIPSNILRAISGPVDCEKTNPYINTDDEEIRGYHRTKGEEILLG